MARPALLELCLTSDSDLEGILTQLQCAGRCLSSSRPLQLDVDGRALQLSVQDLAAAVDSLVREGEESLAQAARKASLKDGAPSEGPSTKGGVKKRGDGGHEHDLINPYTSPRFSTPGPSSAKFDDANSEPGKLDLDSFPSLGSTRQQKVHILNYCLSCTLSHGNLLRADACLCQPVTNPSGQDRAVVWQLDGLKNTLSEPTGVV
jgi:hypothetical protein